jgi:Alpha amylase, catalytic domain
MNVPFRFLKKTARPLTQSTQDALSSQPDLPPKFSHTPGPAPNEACPDNVTMFQAFEWNCPKDQKHWTRLTSAMPSLKSIGIDNMWIPPGCKGGWHGSNGYDIYDLYDLGEFQQKDSKATKWGTKDELVEMTEMAATCGIGIYWDAVLNHKAAADFTEPCYAVKVDPQGRHFESFSSIKLELLNRLTNPLTQSALGRLIHLSPRSYPRAWKAN